MGFLRLKIKIVLFLLRTLLGSVAFILAKDVLVKLGLMENVDSVGFQVFLFGFLINMIPFKYFFLTRFYLAYGIFLGTFWVSQMGTQWFNIKLTSDQAKDYFVYGNIIVPLVLSLIIYNPLKKMLYNVFGSFCRGVVRVLKLPFELVYNNSSIVQKFWNKFTGQVDVSFLNKSLKEIDSLGNGDTYEKGRQFEEYVASIYRSFGYRAMTTTEMRNKGLLPPSIQKRGGSGEQGVDVVVERDVKDPSNPNSYVTERLIIQCKHYSSKVDNSAIQQIVAAKPLYGAQELAVITNNYFTAPAKELAEIHKVAIVDRTQLPFLIKKAVESYKAQKSY